MEVALCEKTSARGLPMCAHSPVRAVGLPMQRTWGGGCTQRWILTGRRNRRYLASLFLDCTTPAFTAGAVMKDTSYGMGS